MLTHRKTNKTFFMADFAASDRRSVHAHLAGTSVRAHAFSMLDWAMRTLRIDAESDAVFQKASHFFYKRRKGIARARRFVTTWSIRIAGLVAGATLFGLFMKT